MDGHCESLHESRLFVTLYLLCEEDCEDPLVVIFEKDNGESKRERERKETKLGDASFMPRRSFKSRQARDEQVQEQFVFFPNNIW
jgi:hypothetical protein